MLLSRFCNARFQSTLYRIASKVIRSAILACIKQDLGFTDSDIGKLV